jgi:hypothetical protein
MTNHLKVWQVQVSDWVFVQVLKKTKLCVHSHLLFMIIYKWLSPAFFIFLLITGIFIALFVISNRRLGLQFWHRYFAQVDGKIFRRRILGLFLIVEVDNPWSFSLFFLVVKDVLM